ncbi:MAG: DUF4340 domain-containing protein, partial [Verrucomicrobiota bacterium]
MSKRQVIVLWAIALVLVVTLIAVKSSRSEGFQSATDRSRGDNLLADFEPTEVAKLEIIRGDTRSIMAKKDGQWVVSNRDDFPADTPAVNELLRTLDEVKVTQGVEADPSFAPRFGMDPKASDDEELGTEMILSNDAGTELARLTFGKNVEGESANPMNPFGGGGGSTGRFVRNHGDSSGIYITSELFPTLLPEASVWLSNDFVKVQRIKSVKVTEAGKPEAVAWELTREDDTKDFTLVGKQDSENIDNSALSPFKNLLSYARFEDVVPAEATKTAWQDDQKMTATLVTFDNFTYTIDFGPAKASEEGSLLKEGDYLMTVAVTAEIAAEREKPEDESEEDAKKADEAFANTKKELEENLAATQKLAGRVFKVSKFTVDALLKQRAD